MTITQTVDIPENRRLVIDLPHEVPAGRMDVIINFPEQDKIQPIASERTETIIPLDTPTPISDSLVGFLSDMGDIDLEELRMERLAKHLK
ncbi:MAG: hypothetical protein FWH12_01680 [Treponema sp.]|nr:hypothetical protein [Treponema sp.]